MQVPEGFQYLPGYFDRPAQETLLDAVLASLQAADTPFYRPAMPRTGKPLSVTMSNLGPLGWVTDKDKGYRYESVHPVTQKPWPAVPEPLLRLWNEVAKYPAPPEACLVNHYDADAKMGMHVDWDEDATDAAVVSISLGDQAMFRLGGPKRGGKTMGVKLSSGDVVVLGGASRACYHGVSRVYPGTSTLLQGPAAARALGVDAGRINLTLRRVTVPE